MPSKSPSQRLRDIADNVEAIAFFVAGMDRDEFAIDQKTVYAVIRHSRSFQRLPEGCRTK